MLFHHRGETKIEICMAQFQFSPSASSVEMSVLTRMCQARIGKFLDVILNRIAAIISQINIVSFIMLLCYICEVIVNVCFFVFVLNKHVIYLSTTRARTRSSC